MAEATTDRMIIMSRGLARVDWLELAGLDAVTQDQFGDRAHDVLVGADGVPVVLDRHQHHVVDALLGDQVFLMIGEDLEEQPLHPLGRRPLERATAQALLLELGQAALADRLDDRILGGEEAVDIGRRHARARRQCPRPPSWRSPAGGTAPPRSP